jgi:hypothetical protein
VDLEDREEGSLATRDQVMTDQPGRPAPSAYWSNGYWRQIPEEGMRQLTRARAEGEG